MSSGRAAPTGPIRRLFIANRGEIAQRIAATAGRLGIEPVLPIVAEHGSRHPTGTGTVDLLDPAAVTAAAVLAGADAVHPGYGFLAESPDLAGAVIDAGLVWIGPPPGPIRLLGDKALARAAARAAGVPVAAGAEPEDQSDATLTEAARAIGLPLLVKPAAGGGGRGIRVVRRFEELPGALESARREARRGFGDERLILERYVSPARHIEVQVLADRHGAVVHLGDRDCSLQRRHQKVLEEAPAPGLDPALRREIRAAAVRIAAAVGYQGAGTCEFLVGDDGAWVFLEMNARLQVEHPVTELVTGRDLVADQLRIGEGARLAELGLDQVAIERRIHEGGHAVEVRLNAEDPARAFLPSTGRIAAVRWPSGSVAFDPAPERGLRVDTGIHEGDRISAEFDPLLAKVIAHGEDRTAALDALAAALDQVEILGLVTNLAFLRRLVRLPLVRRGNARTESLEGLAPDGPVPAMAIPEAAWQLAAGVLAGATGAPVGAAGDGAWRGSWRLNGPATIQLVADGTAGPEERALTLSMPSASGPAASTMDEPARGKAAEPAWARDPESDEVHVSVEGRSVPFRLRAAPDVDRASARRAGTDGARMVPVDEILAPMPGLVLAVHTVSGSAAEAGARLVTLEAMKMEHAVTAPGPAIIAEVLVRPGDQVERGQPLVRLEPPR